MKHRKKCRIKKRVAKELADFFKNRREKRNPLVFGIIAAIIYFIFYQLIGVLFFTGFDFVIGGIAAVIFGIIFFVVQFVLNMRRK